MTALLDPLAFAGSAPAATEVRPLVLVMGLLGGLALFLFGMDQMSDALKAVAGDRMRRLLGRLTTNRVVGALTGAFVTAVIQSSSVTTVLLVGFITAGLMSFTQSIGVIMGANIGTTITAQIIAFRVTEYALLLIASGFGLGTFGRGRVAKRYGAAIMGLGLVFFGMGVMGEAMAPLRSSPLFMEWMVRLEAPALGILVGALFTALVQSSSATTGLVIVFASQGLITLPAGIALIFGANIGTCVTALLAALGKPREAQRAAAVHTVFNVLGVLVWLLFIDQLAALVTAVSPRASGLTGLARLAAETPRQVANAHTLFNVTNTVLFLGFTPWLAKLIERWLPDRSGPAGPVGPKYLDPELLSTPSLALDRVRLEILHQGDRVRAMLAAILPAMVSGTRDELGRVRRMDEAVDHLHGEIVVYLGKISRTRLTEEQTEEFLRLIEAANDLENIGDVIETNLVFLGEERLDLGVEISQETREVITGFHRAVTRAVEAALQAVTQRNEEAARVAVEMKKEINRLADSAAVHGARRLVAEEPNRLPAYTVEIDMLRNLKRIYYFAKRMARAAVPAALGTEKVSG